MRVDIDIPKEAEDTLRQEWGNIDLAATEALLIESYRTGRISVGFLAELLGKSRWDAEAWLGQHGVNWNYDLGDLQQDRATLAELNGDKS